MKYDLLVLPIFVIIVLLAWGFVLPTTPRPAYPVACADIPDATDRLIIVRDGQVECHYKITKVRERK